MLKRSGPDTIWASCQAVQTSNVCDCSWWKETDYWPQAMLQKSCESPVWWRIRYGATRALESNTTSRVPTRRPEGGTERRRERLFYILQSHTKLFISNCWLRSYKRRQSVTQCGKFTAWVNNPVLTEHSVSPPSLRHFPAYFIRLTQMSAWMGYLWVSHRNLIHYISLPPSFYHLRRHDSTLISWLN